MLRTVIASVGVLGLAVGASAQTILAAGGEGNHIVRYRLDDGGVIDHFVADGVSALDFPFAMAIAPDGAVVVCGWQSDTVHRFDPETGEPLAALVPAGVGGILA